MKLLKTIAFSLAFAGFGLTCNADSFDGSAFVRTLREGSTIENSESLKFKKDDILKGEGLFIKTSDSSFASLAFSNNMALIFKENTSAKILKFKLLDIPKIKKDEERCPSIFEIEIEKGTLFMSRAEARATSKFIVKTKFGNLEALGGNIKVFVKENEILVYTYDAAVNYYKNADENPQYIGIGYCANIENKNGKIKLHRSKISPEINSEILDLLNKANDAWKSTYFDYSNPEKPSVKRILSKNFWARPKQVLQKN